MKKIMMKIVSYVCNKIQAHKESVEIGLKVGDSGQTVSVSHSYALKKTKEDQAKLKKIISEVS